MTLAQMIEIVRRDSYFSRPRQAVIDAINAASRRVYNYIQKETPKQKFLKWDTSLTLTKGTEEYQLQPDCKQIARIRELDPASGKWRIIHSTDFNEIAEIEGEFRDVLTYDDSDSRFKFYGPYRKAGTDAYYIQIQPDTDVDRQLEIVYDAAFVEVQTESDYFMIPEEAREIVKNYALAECLENNNDELSSAKEARADKDLTIYCSGILRAGQTQDTPKQEPYL